MIFPTEADTEFFKEAKRIQELWEPKFGDRLATIYFHDILLVVGTMGDYIDHVPLKQDDYGSGVHIGLRKNVIWLPQQGQLQVMLEERGYRWDVGKLPDSYTTTTWNDDVDDSIVECEGPTPSIALGRCLLEVLKEE